MTTSTPIISVIMAVYNDEHSDIRVALESILAQTYKDFEFIIINDGSTDTAIETLLKSYAEKDSRIVIISHENKGLTKSLNVGIRASKGSYIARQDADDVSYPDRFSEQLACFEANDEVVLVGGACDDLYSDGTMEKWQAEEASKLQKTIFLKAPFPHSTAMMKADICKQLNGYDENFLTAQDTELWMRFAKQGRVTMLEKTVLLRNIRQGSISHKRRWRQFYDALRARWKHNEGLMKFYGLYYSIRSLLIGLMPHSMRKRLKRILGT